jgi:electron transfer flavoprotein alpha subunit
MAVLVVAAHDGKTVRANVANAVAAAGQMGPEVHVLVAGSNAGEAAQSAAAIQGVAKVLQAEDAAYANWLAEDIAPLVVKLAPNYSHVVMAADSVGKNIAPRVAALLDVAQVSEAIQVVSPDTFVRPIYAGNAMATVQTADKIKIVTVRPTNFKAAVVACRAARTSRCSRRWPTSSAQASAPAAPRSMRATCRTTTRSARPARWSRPTSTSPSASPAPSSISPA